MLLFPQKADANIDPAGKRFYIISSRLEVNNTLSEQFRLVGFSAVESLMQDFMHADSLNIPSNASGVVVDICTNEQVDEIIHGLQVHIPREVWCCVAGDSDSIALAQAFASHNIRYFNLSTQHELMVQAAVSGVELKTNRHAVSISVLGCKGGVGSTTIGYQLANEIVRIKHMPTLFIQGASGSRDLDLHAGKKLLQEITPVHKKFDLMSSDSQCFPDLKHDSLQKYNFVLFEQSINTADKELLRHLVESSLCLVLILDRSMASVRVARNMIENIELLQRTSRASRRLFLCLNDTRPVSINAVSQDDIQALLGRPIDVTFPYNKQKNPAKSKHPRFVRSLSPLDTLTQYVLGVAVRPQTSLVSRLLTRQRQER
ncbi:hypothetical protein [Serratia marcescens]|uniref:hypothetical protein n=1 Tax=Serratia marcescens TaxID=615 RepID=UPI0002B866CC|nr:hypothetical protein [Serratia marcescens]EMF04245.1 putative tight adherance operon protein [Serratia marcescens VGH107]